MFLKKTLFILQKSLIIPLGLLCLSAQAMQRYGSLESGTYAMQQCGWQQYRNYRVIYIDDCSPDGTYDQVYPLHFAAKRGLPDAIDRELTKGAVDVNARDDKGTTALAWAALNDEPAAIDTLMRHGAAIEQGAKSDSKEWLGEFTPLHWATGLASVTKLVTHGADVEAQDTDDFWTPLHEAAWAANPKKVRVLLELGANVDARTRIGCDTPSRRAFIRGLDLTPPNPQFNGMPVESGLVELRQKVDECLELLRHAETQSFWEKKQALELIEQGIVLRCSGTTPLINALHKRMNPGVVRHLLERGEDPNETISGATPISIATDTCNLAYVRLLVRFGANPHVPGLNGNTAVQIAQGMVLPEALVRFKDAPRAAELAAQKRAQLFVEKYQHGGLGHSMTPLGRAVEEGDVPVVRQLLAMGENPSNGDAKETPLNRAIRKGAYGIVKLLMTTGKLEVDPQTQGDPVELAQKCEHTAIAQLLANEHVS